MAEQRFMSLQVHESSAIRHQYVAYLYITIDIVTFVVAEEDDLQVIQTVEIVMHDFSMSFVCWSVCDQSCELAKALDSL